MALGYKLCVPRKLTDAAEWTAELAEKAAVLGELEKGRAEKTEELQLFLAEMVWAVVRDEFPVARAVELIAKTAVATKEPLQQLFADVLWVVGFSATEAPPSREMRDTFYAFCAALEREAAMPRKLLALSLETEAVPPAVCQIAALKKKHNQAKTKARYTITRYNLLREHTEGFSKLVYLLERLATLDFEPRAAPKQLEETEGVLADDIVRLAGFGHLCPNRMLAMALDIYELRLAEAEPCLLARPILGLLQRFPPKRLTEVVVFQLLAHLPPAGGRDAPRAAPPPPPPAPPSRPSQFLAVASLIQAGLVDLGMLWSYLDPTDAALRASHAELMAKYEEEVSQLSKVDLGSSSSGKDRNSFGRALQDFNHVGHQKLRLAAALVSCNCWGPAHRVLLQLQKLCKPCLNHHVRTALCDLLKWLIWPMVQRASPAMHTSKQPVVESTFGCTRRFSFGLATLGASDPAATATPAAKNGHAAGAAAAAPQALQPSADFEQLLPQIRMILEHLEYFMHTDLHLLTSLWKIVQAYLQEQREKSGNGSHVTLDDSLVAVVYRHLLPAASLVPNNPYLSDLMWSVMQQLSVFQRFLIYSCWETMCEGFLLKLAFEKTKSSTKQILKRVVANAEKRDLIAHQSHFHVTKLCHSNPIPCIETMLKDVEIGFNVNMIQPYVECTNRCSEMTADIMGYMLARQCAKPHTAGRAFLNQQDATLAPWLVNLGEFAGRFYKKHPQTDLVGLLTIITKRVNSETSSLDSGPGGAPSEYKGEALVRVILEKLIEYMGGLLTVADMNAEQLHCLAGGPRLKSESLAIGKKEDTSRKERARQALLAALVDQGLVPVLWYSLSQQRHHFLSEEFSESQSSGGGLKLLGLLFDGNHECFLKLTEFLAQACVRERYASLVPPLQSVFAMFEPSLAFLAIRHGLPPFGRSSAAAAAAATAAAAKDGGEAAAEPEAVVELERVVRLYLPKTFEDEGLSMLFYITFWRLSLPDVYTPNEGYDRQLAHIQTGIKEIDTQRKQMERNRDFSHNREYKALKKETTRLQDFHGKLREEHLQQKYNHSQVMVRLEQEKTRWFTKPSPNATAAFVAEMICPRVLTSHTDALFCCHFVRMLIKLKTPGFQLLDFYNSWTIMLTQCIRCCSEREAQIFGVFLREMMSYVMHLRSDEAAYNETTKDNPCFHRNYYEDPAATAVEWAQFGDIKKGHSKWEGRIYKALKSGLDSDEWMERRNTLLLLSQSYEAFPLVEKYARAILSSVEATRDKEEYTDLKTLATSIAVKLRTQRDRWVDKATPAPEGRSERRAEDGSRRHASGGPKSGLPAGGGASTQATKGDGKADGKADGGSAAGSSTADGGRDRDRDRDRDRSAGDKQDGRDHKSTPIVIKEARDHKTSSAAAKDGKEGKDGREHRDTAGSGGGSDRKRSFNDGRGGDRGAAGHDERSDKRRRSERDDGGGHGSSAAAGASHGGGSSRSGGGGASDRGASDRHGGSYSSSHQPRNALSTPADQGTYYRSSAASHDYARGGRSSGSYAHTGGHRGGDSYRRR